MDKIKCGIYARVSTDRQGDSIENQVDQAREYLRRLEMNMTLKISRCTRMRLYLDTTLLYLIVQR